MKVSMSEATARKVLAVLEDGDHHDQDLVQLKERVQGGLKATTGAGFLSAGDLGTLVFLVTQELKTPKHSEPGGPFQEALGFALPKLQNLLARRVEEEGR